MNKRKATYEIERKTEKKLCLVKTKSGKKC